MPSAPKVDFKTCLKLLVGAKEKSYRSQLQLRQFSGCSSQQWLLGLHTLSCGLRQLDVDMAIGCYWHLLAIDILFPKQFTVGVLSILDKKSWPH